MADLNNRPQLILRNRVLLLIRVNMKQTQDAHRHFVNDKNDRRQYLHDRVNRSCKPKRYCLGIQRGGCLWCDLSKNKNQKSQHTGRRSYISISEHPGDEYCHERGRGKIDNIIADQNCAQHLRLIVKYLCQYLRTAESGLRQSSHPNLVYCHHRRLCGREK